jgi:hypothetical protein
MSTGVRNQLTALQFGGTTAIAQSTKKNVAGGQIQPVKYSRYNTGDTI